MGISLWHIIVVLIIVLIFFGPGKLPQLFGDLGKGLRSFKDGLKGEDDKKDDKLPPPDQQA